MPVYSGYASQRGYGLGNVLGGIFRSALPVVGSIAKKAARSAASTAMNTGLSLLKQTLKRGKRKASSSTSGLPAKRRKGKSAKRTTSVIRKHLRKTPPGKPVTSKRKTGKRKVTDIFTT